MSAKSDKTDLDLGLTAEQIEAIKREKKVKQAQMIKYIPMDLKKAQQRLKELEANRAYDLKLKTKDNPDGIYTEEDLLHLEQSDPHQLLIWNMKQQYDRTEAESKPEINLKPGLIVRQKKLINEIQRKYVENS